MFDAEQQALDAYNAQPRRRVQVCLARLSRLHTVVHVATDALEFTKCGLRMWPDHARDAQGGKSLCGKCRRWMEKYTMNLTVEGNDDYYKGLSWRVKPSS